MSLARFVAALTALAALSSVPSVATPVNGRVSAAPALHLGPAVNIEGWFRWNRHVKKWDQFFTAADAQQLVDLGFESVRLALFPQYFMQHDGSVDHGRWDHVETAVDRLTTAGLSVVVDLHSETQVMKPFLASADYRRRYTHFVGEVAALVSARDASLVGLSLFNEPHDTKGRWDRWQRDLYDAARTAAPDTTLVLTSDDWGSAKALVEDTTYIHDANVVWDVHDYDPFPFTHQGASWAGPPERFFRRVPYPSTPRNVRRSVAKSLAVAPDAWDDRVRQELDWYGHQRWDARRVGRVMRRLARWSAAHDGARVWIGEFGVIDRAAPAAAYRWWTDTRTAAEAAGIPWATWFWWDWNDRHGDGDGYDEGLAKALLG